MANRFYAFLAALAMLLTSGVLYHSLAADSVELDAAAARVPLVPMIVGDWHGQEEVSDDGAFAQTGAKGYWTRQYIHQKTKDSVLVILMCGRAGKMAVHTPEVCYRGAGYELRDEPAPIVLNHQNHETGQFWTAHFTKKSGQLRLYWAWNAGAGWEANSAPRWQFRGKPFLYKLYVSRDTSRHPNVAAKDDVTAEFLQGFLPVMNQTLFSANEG